jgi:hypothetical protein
MYIDKSMKKSAIIRTTCFMNFGRGVSHWKTLDQGEESERDDRRDEKNNIDPGRHV